MEIINTVITRTATEQTANASYTLDYTVTNGALTHVQANIRALPASIGEAESLIGNIYYNQGFVNCNLPYDGNDLPLLFSDFDNLVNNVKVSVEAENKTDV